MLYNMMKMNFLKLKLALVLMLFGCCFRSIYSSSFVFEKIEPQSFQADFEEMKITGGVFQENGDFNIKFSTPAGVEVATVSGNRFSNTELGLTIPALDVGLYSLTIEDANSPSSATIAPILVRKHNGYTISNFVGETGNFTSSDIFNVAGGKTILIIGEGVYQSSDAMVRFADDGLGSIFSVDVPAQVVISPKFSFPVIKVTIPPWKLPLDWTSGCVDDQNPVKSEDCVPDLSGNMRLSLDGGTFFSNKLNITLGFFSKLKIAYIYPSPVNDFGWAFQLNTGRIDLEASQGGRIDGSTYVESVVEGTFAAYQENIGKTIETNTSVPEFINGEPNDYFPAFNLLKGFCDDGFDLIFTTSFGFHAQTVDVSSSYEPCRNTKFVNIGGIGATDTVSVAFAKIYQVRYLSGRVAGGELSKLAAAGESEPCVGWLSAYPLPETQRGVNAFLLGCQSIFPACKVKVLWTGTWSDADLERNAAEFLWEVGKCKVVAQHSDTAEPQLVYAEKGGSGIGYNSDVRLFVGDSVLTSPLFSWGHVFDYFLEKLQNGQLTTSEFYWPGSAEGAVKLPSSFSPRVPLSDQEAIIAEKEILDEAFGDDAFRHIFCGPLKKRWVYRTKTDDFLGPRAKGCGFQPKWIRLDEAEQVNVKHYRDEQGNNLDESVTELNSTHCLDGVSFPGQALLSDAFPSNFSEDNVFNDYLLDGIELFEPQDTLYGKIFGNDNPCFLEYGPTGERFYQPPVLLPKCDGSQWIFYRDTCNPRTLRTSILASYKTNENSEPLLCGSAINEVGNIVDVSPLPHIIAGPSCDYVPLDSTRGSTIFALVTIGGVFSLLIVCCICVFRKNSNVMKMQPNLVLLMAIIAAILNFSLILFVGELSDAKCIARVLTIHICFDLIFAILWGKIYRVYTIFQRVKRFRSVKIYDKDVLKIAFLIVSVDLTILIFWMVLDPPQMKTVIVSFDGIEGLERKACVSDSNVYETASIFYKGLLIASACGLVFASRKIPAEFVEHKYIVFAAYYTAAMAAVIFPFQLVSEDITLNNLLTVIALSAGSIIVVGSLALPSILVALNYLNVSTLTSGDSRVDVNPESLGKVTEDNLKYSGYKSKYERPGSLGSLEGSNSAIRTVGSKDRSKVSIA